MTLEQQVGQLLWCGWGQEPEPRPREYNDHARCLVEELQAGGLILFTRNLGSPEEIAALTTELRRHARVPPLIGIDQEGGRVCRLPLPGLTFSGNMALGALDVPARTRAVALAIGRQLGAVGIDVDFAPVLDVNNNPLNPIIGVRSYGEDPDLVARHGIAAVAGFREAGILPVVKHFPGHGDTAADSHLELPVQAADRARLDRVELVPFRAAIGAAQPMAVMTTHILFPSLDPELPATLSRRILTGLLRTDLGYDGLVVTDCMEMEGIAGRWSPEEAAVLAIDAGADMLLVCHTLETQARMHGAVCEAVRSGRISEERLAGSLRRIEAARRDTSRVRESLPDLSLPGAPEFLDLEARIAEESLTLFSDGPRNWAGTGPVAVSGSAGAAALLAAALQERGLTAAAVSRTDLAALRESPQLLWIALPHDPFPGGKPSPEVFRLLREHPRVAAIAAREPYCLEHYPESIPRLTAWGSGAPNLRAVARWVAGEIAAASKKRLAASQCERESSG
jgi:beta-N-acetylhexosaminidase